MLFKKLKIKIQAINFLQTRSKNNLYQYKREINENEFGIFFLIYKDKKFFLVITSKNYSQRLGYLILTKIIKILECEENLDILEEIYIKKKYLKKIKEILDKAENPIEFDKLTRAIDLSEKLKNKARDNLEKIILIGDDLNVF